MLRRRSLKARSDLKRRRSTSSTHGVVLEHLNPARAQRDAHIAACEAYARAQSRTSEMSLFPPTPELSPRRRRSEWSGQSQDGPKTPGRGDDNGQDLRRYQSVRFMGPCSLQAMGRHGRPRSSSYNSKDPGPDSTDKQEDGYRNIAQSHSRSLDDTDPVQVPSPPRRAPPPVPLPRMATDYLAALDAQDEYYTPEDDIASAPSSYRRLHKSKSRFAEYQGFRKSHERSIPSLQGKSPRSRPLLASDTRRLFRSDPNDKVSHGVPSLRAPKSMSFLNSRSSQSRSSTSHDGGRRDPRIADLPDVPEDESSGIRQSSTRTRSRTSALFGSQNRRVESRFRESLRSDSPIEDTVADGPYPGAPQDAPGTLKSRARKASRTLRVKLRNLFTLAKPEGEMSIPCQHIESQRTHVIENSASFHGRETEDEAPVDEIRGLIHEVPAKIPYFQFAQPGIVHSSRASLESLRSEAERKVSDSSSLTSWVHSGPSTLTSQQQQQWREWEKQRLSIIRESGTHGPSPSAWRQPLGTGLFQRPESIVEDAIAPRQVVDSQRVYSALMKRMRAMNGQSAQSSEQESHGSEPGHSAPFMEHVDRSPDRTPDTIRRVTEEKSGIATGDIVTPTRVSRRSSQSRSRFSRTVSGSIASGRTRLRDSLGRPARDGSGTSARHSMSQGSVRESRPVGSPASHVFRTSSPYRRALRVSMQEEQHAWSLPSCGTEQDSDTGTQLHHPSKTNTLPETDSDSAKDLDYTESVYSTDDGQAGLGQADDTPTTYRPAGYREHSTASSIGWKTWLSANMGTMKFDPSSPPSPSKQLDPEFALLSMPPSFPSGHFPGKRHVRESAQIYADEDDDDVFEPPTRKPTLPTTPLKQVEHNAAQSSPLQRSVKRITTTSSPTSSIANGNGNGNGNGKVLLVENENPSAPSSPSLLPPPIPPRSKLRPSPLRVSRTKFSSPYSVTSSPGLTEAVRRQFGGV
ncbi:hypothetical protein BT67DRAFT_347057, partial [Trichocladium antarcticum]